MSACAPIPLVPMTAGTTQATAATTTAAPPFAPSTSSGVPSAPTPTQNVLTSTPGQLGTAPPAGAPAANTAPNTTPGNPTQANSGNRYWSTLAHINVPVATWLGVGLATGALLVAIYYGAPLYRLAIWTAKKDFREACVNDQSIGLTSAACNATLQNPTLPPPVRKRDLARHKSQDTMFSPVRVATSITAGLAMLVAVSLMSRKRLGGRPSSALSMARSSLACIVRYCEWSVKESSQDTSLVFVAIAQDRGILLNYVNSMPGNLAGSCVFCSGDVRQSDGPDKILRTMCGHHTHSSCAAVGIRKNGSRCPSCGGNLAKLCSVLSSNEGNDTVEDPKPLEQGENPLDPLVLDDLDKQHDDDSEQHDSSKSVQSDAVKEHRLLQNAVQTAHHAVALEFSDQYQAALDAYYTICRLLATHSSKTKLPSSKIVRDIDKLGALYKQRAQDLQHLLSRSSDAPSPPPTPPIPTPTVSRPQRPTLQRGVLYRRTDHEDIAWKNPGAHSVASRLDQLRAALQFSKVR